MVQLADVAIAAGATAQAVTGIGFSLVCAPFLVASTGPHEGVRLVNTLALSLNAAALIREGRHVRPRDTLSLLFPALLAVPVVAWVARHSPAGVLAVAAGVMTLAGAGVIAAGRRVHWATGRAGAVAAGVTSGAMNVIAGIGGPAAALYALNAGWPPRSTRPTLQAYFLVLNVASVAALGPPHNVLRHASALVVGWTLGVIIARRVDETLALRVTLSIAAMGGVTAIARGLS